MNANKESLTQKHGDKAADVHRELCDLGGYGNVPYGYTGGLDILGVLDPSNTAISEKDKDRIAELSGVSRKDVDRRVESGEVKSKESFIDATPKFPKA